MVLKNKRKWKKSASLTSYKHKETKWWYIKNMKTNEGKAASWCGGTSGASKKTRCWVTLSTAGNIANQ